MSEAMNAARPGDARSATVIGGGIVGACAALRLRECGFDVALVERDRPGEACSFGNAGRIATALARPKSVPGLLRKVPAMLRDPRHPLKTSLGFIARNHRWFSRFARAGRRDEVERITVAMHRLLEMANAAVERLTSDIAANDVLQRDGVFYVYKDPALAEAARDEMDAAIRRGLQAEFVSGEQIRDIDPAIPTSVRCGYYKPNERFVRSPLELTQAVIDAFERAGGRLVHDQVTALEHRSGKAPRVCLRSGSLECDKVVLAAGAWSPRLAATLGLPLLVVAERGYHAGLPNARVGLKTALHFGDRLVSITPMTGGLRVTSGAEFADPDAPPNWARRDVVIDGARMLYPDLDVSDATRWMGSRPSTPDTLPVIGAPDSEPDLLIATGHGTLGLTLAAVTADAIAALASGVAPAFDTSAYRPDRFRAKQV